MSGTQAQVDKRNAAFWDELCGTRLANQLGVTDDSPESLARYDSYYMDYYPYLEGYLPRGNGDRNRVLEIGLGYGTLSQLLASRGLDYHGLDVAEGPVSMVRHRLGLLGVEGIDERVAVGSILQPPFPPASFDHIVTVGCLHHTGDLAGAIRNVHGLLRPGGRALVMVYNRHSYRRLWMALREFPARLLGRRPDEEAVRGAYDRDLAGNAAPATEYTSSSELRQLFEDFSAVEVRRENFAQPPVLGPLLRRERLLGWPARIAGLDLYVTAVR